MSRLLAGVLAALALLACAAPAFAQQQPPNIVVIMTDDQTAASVPMMPQLNALIANEGTNFEQAIASFPLCCPSRATNLTGQYAHNHGVLHNSGLFGGVGVWEFATNHGVPPPGPGLGTALRPELLTRPDALMRTTTAADLG